MAKNKTKGLKDKVVGSVKEGTGKLTGDEELELKGKLQKEKGKVKEKVSDVKDSVKDKSDDTKRDVRDFGDNVKDKARDAKKDAIVKTNEAIDEMNRGDK